MTAVAALRLLLVEDSATDARLVLHELERLGRAIETERVETAESLRAALLRTPWDLVLSDWSMPRFSGAAALAIMKEMELDVPFIIVSGTVGEEIAVEAMRGGARDYVLKDRLSRLSPAIERELKAQETRRAYREAEALRRTGEQRSKEALRASEAQYKYLVETGNQGIWAVDLKGRTTFVNARMARMLACSVDELAGMSPVDFLDETGRAAFAEHRAAHRKGLSRQSEVEFHAKDGVAHWAIVESSPVLGASGETTGAFTTVLDVTERRDAQEAVRRSEARYRRLAESGLLGIIIVNASGVVVEANHAFLEMLGYASADVVAGALSWRTLTPPEWASAGAHAAEQLSHHGVARPWEKEYFGKDGSRVPVLVGVATLGDQTIALSIDLTERNQAQVGRTRAEASLRHTEEQLRQAQKMEAVGRLAGGIAHDFNNVLSVILSYAEMLLTDLPPGDPMREDVTEIHKAGNRAADLTRQLLMFSRQQVLAPKVLDLNEVLAGMHKMLKRVLGEDVELVSTAGPRLGRVRADPSSVEQVIMNLVVNARDAMPVGGKLTMETANIELDDAYTAAHLGASAGPHVVLSATDTGTGIEKATLTRIFEPFFTTKGIGKGTGLGLSTVFGIVQQSGGSVWVDSEVGNGTTFKVYFPRIDGPVEIAHETVPHAMLHGSETILLVEDDDQLRAVARSILERAGYHLLDARDGGEALLASVEHLGPIHLLLTDVVMPRMGGPALARQLATERPEMKVLCMSGYTDDSIVRHGVLEGQLAFVQKPFTPLSLLAKVREVLESGAVAGISPVTPAAT